MSPSFLETPDLPMEMIMNNLDYIAIQSVRKTCWDLRNFIDDKKPEACVKRINISEKSDTLVRLAIIFPSLGPKGAYINVRYEKHEYGCRMLRATSDGLYKTKIVENLNFLDAVLHDFKIAINTQKSPFEMITVTSKTFFEKFEENMMSQKPIATERMEIYVNSLEHARQILQHADPTYLKLIDIHPHGYTSIHETMRFNINSHEVIVIREKLKFESSKNNQDLSHFSITSIQFDNIDVETLRTIKENFLQFHEYDKYLFVINVVRENLFIDAFGAAFESPEEKGENWFFNVPGNKERVLKVYNKYILFEFFFIEKCEVPEGYVIRD
ncbi:hypothetical protein GCK72_021383 [Caenorhabditis remanei]|uniref:F-box domain-containing protein n=1 Tax=Caenorhabditis remanei TaxID=31234 RepID=A0A6A5GKF7_CAERE|nr:hypothetical protein GCK72_021383 [Caenorhabditis remanei]KAF1754819.1 hypothetical protein GCK72_021383 [Caenorhabditis remanei]